MLKLSYKPIFSNIPNKFIIPSVPFSVTNSLQTPPPPPVRQNASPTLPLSTLPFLPPTSAYIHLPFCRKRCHYCDFPIVALGSSNQHEDDPRITNYVQLLCQEINTTKPPHPTTTTTITTPLETIFFGGGTPSLVPPKLVSSILNTLKHNHGVLPNAEVSIEMDPGTFDAAKLNELMELGVNRVSLGVQAFQEELLKKCGRAHGLEEVHQAIEIIKSSGLKNWSLDLISSLPHQTLQNWEESLEETLKANPTHVSVYDLQVEQGTKFGNLYTPGEFPLPSESQSADFYRMASKTLSKAGYEHYEISSYSKNGYQCKHNLAYWKNKSYYAFGLGSASYINGVRFSRPKKMKEYANYVHDLETGVVKSCIDMKDMKDMAMDVVMLSLRTAVGLDLKYFEESFGRAFVVVLCKSFKTFVESGHVVFLDEKRNECEVGDAVAFVRLSDPEGFLMSNELISSAFGAMDP